MPGARHLKKSRLSAMRAQSLSEASADATVKMALREAGYHTETGEDLVAVVEHLIDLTRGVPIPPELARGVIPTQLAKPAPPPPTTRPVPFRGAPAPGPAPAPAMMPARPAPGVPPGVQIPRQPPPAPRPPTAPPASHLPMVPTSSTADFDFGDDEPSGQGEVAGESGDAPDLTDPAVFARVAQEKIAANLAKSEREGIKIRKPGLGGGLPGAVPPSERPTRQKMSIDAQRAALESVTGHPYIPPDASGGNPNMKPPGGGPGPRGGR